MRKKFDRKNNLLKVGNQVMVIRIPQSLPEGLPEEDVIAINSQMGKTLIIEGFSENGDVELEFFDDFGHSHTIWIDASCLKKIE